MQSFPDEPPPLPPPALPPQDVLRQHSASFPSTVVNLLCSCSFLPWLRISEVALPASEPSTPAEPSAKRLRGKTRDVEAPRFGWSRRGPKESHQMWYARVQAFLDGPQKQSQGFYLKKWRSMDESSCTTWQNDMRQRAGEVVAQDVLQPAGSQVAVPDLPDQDSAQTCSGPSAPQANQGDDPVRDLLAKYKDVSESAAACQQHPEARYRMYTDLAALIQKGIFKSVRAACECPGLRCLRLDRDKLGTVLEMQRFGGGVPKDVPPKFRIGLRVVLCTIGSTSGLLVQKGCFGYVFLRNTVLDRVFHEYDFG